LTQATVFPKDGKEIADLYASVADSLGIDSADVFGASSGGFIAMSFAFYHPKRVKSLALFGPMGLNPLSGKSIFMLSISTLYPFQFIRNYVAQWALGNDPYVKQKYGDWFEAIVRGTIPSVAKPVPLTTDQKKNIKIPVLLFLGTKDPIVGDAEQARKVAEEFPNIQVEILESGHLISVEQAEHINKRIHDFLDVPD
jgi:pimeloyl-ACP methyl ester carboxylesterase